MHFNPSRMMMIRFAQSFAHCCSTSRGRNCDRYLIIVRLSVHNGRATNPRIFRQKRFAFRQASAKGGEESCIFIFINNTSARHNGDIETFSSTICSTSTMLKTQHTAQTARRNISIKSVSLSATLHRSAGVYRSSYRSIGARARARAAGSTAEVIKGAARY